jgi:hypothetical protein
VWPEITPGTVFDPDVDAPQQMCKPCPPGEECVLDRCFQCEYCSTGKYKDSLGTAPCRNCSVGTYNPLVGAASEALCINCPEGSDTRGLEAQDELGDCDCIVTNYMTVSRIGPLGMRCFQCPAAALCPDGTCGFRNPGFTCSGIGSYLKPSIPGTWVRDPDERFSLISCPTGHRLINTTGYKLQECARCPDGMYIISSSHPLYRCYKCPPSALCPNRSPPIFPEVMTLVMSQY